MANPYSDEAAETGKERKRNKRGRQKRNKRREREKEIRPKSRPNILSIVRWMKEKRIRERERGNNIEWERRKTGIERVIL